MKSLSRLPRPRCAMARIINADLDAATVTDKLGTREPAVMNRVGAKWVGKDTSSMEARIYKCSVRKKANEESMHTFAGAGLCRGAPPRRQNMSTKVSRLVSACLNDRRSASLAGTLTYTTQRIAEGGIASHVRLLCRTHSRAQECSLHPPMPPSQREWSWPVHIRHLSVATVPPCH